MLMKRESRKRTTITALAAVMLAVAGAFAGDTGESFLKLGIGARAAGMGESHTAGANDLTAMYWNPANLVLTGKYEFGASHAVLFQDAGWSFAGFSKKLEDGGAIGFGGYYLDYGDLAGRSEHREDTGKFKAYDSALSFTYSVPKDDLFSYGFTVRGFYSKIETESAYSFNADVGVRQGLKSLPLSFGLTVRNIGPNVKYLDESDPQPLTMAIGGWYDEKKWDLTSDLKYRPNDGQFQFAVGGEYWLVEQMAMRIGFNTKDTQVEQALGKTGIGSLENLVGLSAGVGLRIGEVDVDYAFRPEGELGNSQEFMIKVRL